MVFQIRLIPNAVSSFILRMCEDLIPAENLHVRIRSDEAGTLSFAYTMLSKKRDLSRDLSLATNKQGQTNM